MNPILQFLGETNESVVHSYIENGKIRTDQVHHFGVCQETLWPLALLNINGLIAFHSETIGEQIYYFIQHDAKLVAIADKESLLVISRSNDYSVVSFCGSYDSGLGRIFICTRDNFEEISERFSLAQIMEGFATQTLIVEGFADVPERKH